MAYQNNIPLATDQLSISQSDIQNNFIALGTLLNPDSGGITFPLQAGAPAANATLQMYSVNNGAGKPALFIERETGSADFPTIIDFTSSTKASTGYTILPSGILIKWGTGACVSNTGGNATFDSTVAFTSIFSIQITPLFSGSIVGSAYWIPNADLTKVYMYCNGQNVNNFTYLAIGIRTTP